MSEIELILKSPTDRIAPFTIKCNISWTIKQLKEHIKNIYPLKPTVESQKVIYVGKLLKDDQVLKNLFQPESSTIVHFICQSSISETEKKADDVKKLEITPEKCPDLYKEYQNYVSSYYAASASQPFAAMNHYQQQMMWMMNQAYMQQYANYYAQFSSTGSDSSVPQVPSPIVTRESSVQQQQQNQDQNNERRVDAPAVGGGGGAAAAGGENGGMQNMMAAAFGGLMGDGGEDENDGDVEPRDLLHYFYILVRFALLLLICYYYSSVASVVTTLMLFFLFFGVNLLRRNHNNRAVPVPAVPVGQINPAVPESAATTVVNGDRVESDADRAAVGPTSYQNEEGGDNNNINVTTATTGTTTGTSAAAISNDNSPSAPPSVVVVGTETLPTITERLKRAATTSLQFVLTFFVTLFPEPIAQIDIN